MFFYFVKSKRDITLKCHLVNGQDKVHCGRKIHLPLGIAQKEFG